MASKNIKFVKKVGNITYECLPATSAGNVTMNSGSSVETIIGSLSSSISTLQSQVSTLQSQISTLQTDVSSVQNKLDSDNLYMKNSNGAILTDGSGNNLVAIH